MVLQTQRVLHGVECNNYIFKKTDAKSRAFVSLNEIFCAPVGLNLNYWIECILSYKKNLNASNF